MGIPNKEDVQILLSEFEERIRCIVDAAWQEWQEFPDKGKYIFLPRLRAVVVFDAIARLSQLEFVDDPNIHVIVKKQTIQFLFHKQVLLRFKKGNSKGVGSNIETQAVLDFIDPQRTIPGLIPDIMKVEVCYRHDELGITLDEVAVVARDRRKRIWSYPLDRATPSAEVTPLPPRTPDTTPPIVVEREPAQDKKPDQTE
jgi:hypothetical protein